MEVQELLRENVSEVGVTDPSSPLVNVIVRFYDRNGESLEHEFVLESRDDILQIDDRDERFGKLMEKAIGEVSVMHEYLSSASREQVARDTRVIMHSEYVYEINALRRYEGIVFTNDVIALYHETESSCAIEAHGTIADEISNQARRFMAWFHNPQQQ